MFICLILNSKTIDIYHISSMSAALMLMESYELHQDVRTLQKEKNSLIYTIFNKKIW
jgi:hypothetical protein